MQGRRTSLEARHGGEVRRGDSRSLVCSGDFIIDSKKAALLLTELTLVSFRSVDAEAVSSLLVVHCAPDC